MLIIIYKILTKFPNLLKDTIVRKLQRSKLFNIFLCCQTYINSDYIIISIKSDLISADDIKEFSNFILNDLNATLILKSDDVFILGDNYD